MPDKTQPLLAWTEEIEDRDGDTLRLDFYDDGETEVHVIGRSVVLTPALRDKLREVLDRAAMPGQPGARADGGRGTDG